MPRRLILAAVLSALAVLAAAPAGAVAGPVTLTTTASGANTVVTATAPSVNATTTNATVTQTFDPLGARLTGIADVVAPQGWTTTYSSNGTTFGVAPTTTAGWAAITAVKTTGPMVSTGASGANQALASNATVQESTTGAINGASSTGDGWTVFTSPTRIYTIWHHNGRNDLNQGAFDCFNRDGSHCAGFPFMLTPLETGTRPDGWFDETNNHIWGVVSRPTGTSAGPGFVCVDVSGATPQYCGGSVTTGFISTRSTPPVSSGDYCGNTQGNALNCANDFAEVDGKLYAWEALTGKLMCVDTQAASGAGAPCTGQPYAFSGIGGAATFRNATVTDRRSGLAAIGGKIYGAGTAAPGTTTGSIPTCFDPVTRATCAGWPKTATSGLRPYIYEQVDASGTSQGICFRALTTGASSNVSCYQPNGTAFGTGAAPTVNAGLRDAIIMSGRTYSYIIAKNPVRIGTKYIWSSVSWQTGANTLPYTLYCYNVATSSSCTGWPKTNVLNYSMAGDEYNPDCVWKATDDGSIQGYDLATGVAGCEAPCMGSTCTVEASGLMSDLTCARSGLSAWESIAVTGTTFTSATLTVKNGGTIVTGWNAVSFVGTSVNLSSLTVAASGTNPTFEITFTGRNAVAPVVTLTSVSGTPQLCLTLQPQPGCPITAGQYTDPLPSVTTAVTGAGLATTGSGTETFTDGTTTVTQASATAAQCLGVIQGTTTVDGTTTPIPGVVVTLTDSNGTTIATATTDASGFYSFPGLAAITAGYKVSFGSATGMNATAPTTAAPSTSRTVTVGGTTVVNGQYAPLPGTLQGTATVDGTTTPVPGAVVTLTNGTTVVGTATTDANGFYQFPNLPPGSAYKVSFGTVTGFDRTAATIAGAGTSQTVTGGGTTVVDGQYVAAPTSSAPNSGSGSGSGSAPAPSSPSTTNRAAEPAAQPNFATTPPGTAVTLPLFGNDAASSGATLMPSTVKLQDPKTGTWGAAVSVAGEGGYVVNPATGAVTFKPIASFTGTTKKLPYRVKDTAGKTASSYIQITVAATSPKPRLSIRTTATVPNLIRGQRTVIRLHACNVGTATATATTLNLPIPAGFAVVDTRGAKLRSGTATWSTGTLKQGACVDRTILVVAVRQGKVRALGTVRATNADPAADPTPLRVTAGVAGPSVVTG
jgi:CshA-type fibril repeat protein